MSVSTIRKSNLKQFLGQTFDLRGSSVVFKVNGRVIAQCTQSRKGDPAHHPDWPETVVAVSLLTDSSGYLELVRSHKSDVMSPSNQKNGMIYYDFEGDILYELLSKFTDSGAKISTKRPRYRITLCDFFPAIVFVTVWCTFT